MGGIMHDELHTTLQLDENLEVVVVITVGKIAPAEDLEGVLHEREVAPRERLALDEIVLHGLRN
jgi:hypothetical protein